MSRLFILPSCLFGGVSIYRSVTKVVKVQLHRAVLEGLFTGIIPIFADEQSQVELG